MSKHQNDLHQGGLFTSPVDLRAIQRQVVRSAEAQSSDEHERARFIADEREIRYRSVIKSAVLWTTLGIPLCIAVVLLVLFVFASAIVPR